MSGVVLMEAQIKIIMAHLTSIDFKCGCCQGQDFDPQQALHEIRNFSAIDNNINNERAPLMSIVCKRCGNNMLLSAVYLGLVPNGRPGFKPILQ